MNGVNIDDLRQSISKIENASGAKHCKTNKSDTNKCFKRILVLVNYRERCIEELYQRLVVQEKFSEEEFDEALSKAKKYDLVCDERYAEMYAFCKTQSCRGTYGVEQHFRRMKIDYQQMPKVMEVLNEAKISELQHAKDYIGEHKSRSKDQFSGNVRKLIGRGYSAEVAIKASKSCQQYTQIH